MTNLKTRLKKHAQLCLSGSESLERFRDEILPHCSLQRMDAYLNAACQYKANGGTIADYLPDDVHMTHGQRAMLKSLHFDEVMGLICYLSFATVMTRRDIYKHWEGNGNG